MKLAYSDYDKVVKLVRLRRMVGNFAVVPNRIIGSDIGRNAWLLLPFVTHINLSNPNPLRLLYFIGVSARCSAVFYPTDKPS